MAGDSGLFLDALVIGALPLYEAKMMHQFDHRFATYEGATAANMAEGSLPQLGPERKADPWLEVQPRYWVNADEVEARLEQRDKDGNIVWQWKKDWLLAFRDVTSNVTIRTAIFSLLPRVAVGHKAPLIFLPDDDRLAKAPLLLGNLNALVFDYIVRQKATSGLSYFIVKQLPVLPPAAYTEADADFILPLILELVYTSWDMKPFAEDMNYNGPPFIWDEDRRGVLRAELDAYYARLYGLNRKQLRYTLDPHGLSDRELEDILDPWEEPSCAGPHLLPDHPTQDFPGETFRVLKENEERKYGEYRTRRLVLEAWARLEAGLGPAPVRNYREMVEAKPAETVPTPQPATAVVRSAPHRRPAPTPSEPAELVLVSPDYTPQQQITFEAASTASAVPTPAPTAVGRRIMLNGAPAVLLAEESTASGIMVTVRLDGEEKSKKYLSPPAEVAEP